MPHLNARAKFWGGDTGHSINFTRRRSRNQELLSRFRALAPPNRSRAARIFPGSARASPKCPSWFKQRKSLARRQRQHARARALPRPESQPQKLRDNESAQAPPTNILQKPRILRRKTINQAKLQKLLIYTHNLALLIDCFKQSISWLLSGWPIFPITRASHWYLRG